MTRKGAAAADVPAEALPALPAAVLDHDGPWTEAAYLDLASSVRQRGARRLELVDGALLAGPGATEERARVVDRVREAITAALPDGLRVVGPVALRLGPDCVLVPDLVVARAIAPVEDADAAVELVDAVAAPVAAAADGQSENVEEQSENAAVQAEDADAPDEEVAEATDAAVEQAGSLEVLDAADVLMVVEVVGRENGAVDRVFKPQVYARGRIPYSVLVDHDGPFAAAAMIIGGRYHEYARVSGADGVLALEEPFRLAISLEPSA